MIPAHNSATTIERALRSLQAQTFEGWEAIVVDDGSTDETADVADEMGRSDERVGVIRLARCGGAAAARNAGIDAASSSWLLFLDADDWALPRLLETLVAAVEANPALDAAYCGWLRVAPSGEIVARELWEPRDMFEALSQTCVFAINSCLVRRSLVLEVGGFDPALRTSEDWDLWQRLARCGASFGVVKEYEACYRIRPGSLSSDGRQLFADGLQVVVRAHGPDPRVPRPLPALANGRPVSELERAKVPILSWCAGLMVGSGHDAAALAEAVGAVPDIEPATVAAGLYWGTLLARGEVPAAWFDLSSSLAESIARFILVLERQTGARDVARRVSLQLAELAIDRISHRPTTFGLVHALRVDVSHPLADISVPRGVQRLRVDVTVGARAIGVVQLPALGETTSARILADAIAGELAWPLLGCFFERTVYRQRGIPAARHDTAGWETFLQELWDAPQLAASDFYRETRGTAAARVHAAPTTGWITLELSDDLPDVATRAGHVVVVPTVGGAPLGVVHVDARRGVVTARRLRSAITDASGFELARAAVREGLLGRPFDDPASLRERLRQAARSHRARIGDQEQTRPASLLLPRRRPEEIGTSASRLAALPGSLARELEAAATALDEPAVRNLDSPGSAVLYVPDELALHHRNLSLRHATPNVPARESAASGLAGRLRAKIRRGNESPERASRIPVLMYHRIADDGAAGTARYRVSPDSLAEQLRHLRENGYRSISLAELQHAVIRQKPPRGRPVVVTFDDGYRDFQTHAWPLLREYRYSAVVFLVAEALGQLNVWDAAFHEQLPLLDWPAIHELGREGVEFGSHTCTHRPLTALSHEDAARECFGSRAFLEQSLGTRVRAIAYPYGDVDPVVSHIAGACGYVLGLTCAQRHLVLSDRPLEIPRIEVAGSDGLDDFARKLSFDGEAS